MEAPDSFRDSTVDVLQNAKRRTRTFLTVAALAAFAGASTGCFAQSNSRDEQSDWSRAVCELAQAIHGSTGVSGGCSSRGQSRPRSR